MGRSARVVTDHPLFLSAVIADGKSFVRSAPASMQGLATKAVELNYREPSIEEEVSHTDLYLWPESGASLGWMPRLGARSGGF